MKDAWPFRLTKSFTAKELIVKTKNLKLYREGMDK